MDNSLEAETSEESGGPSKRRRSRSAEASSPQRKFACEMDDTFERTFERPPYRTDSDSDVGEMLVVQDTSLPPELDIPPDPFHKALRLQLRYSQSLSTLPSFGSFVRSLKNALPPTATVSRVLPSKMGFLVETRYPNAVAASMQGYGWTASYVPPPPSFVDIVVRGVHTAASEIDLFTDLQDHLGQDRVRHVRRLHAMTKDGPDRTRPIPVIVAKVQEDVVEKLRSWRIFGLFRPNVSAKPCKPSRTPQCRNCYTWGHHTGACKAARRCAICGATSHLRDTCTKASEPKRCFTCGGPHLATYGGCPARRQEDARVREAIVPRTFSAEKVSTSRSFAAVAGQATDASSNRFAPLLDLDDSAPPEMRPEQERDSNRPSLTKPRQERSRELAERLRETRIRRDNITAELERVQQANRTKANPELRQRIRALQRRLRSSQLQLCKLNELRHSEITSDTPPIPPVENRNLLGRLLDLLRPVLSQWLGPSAWAAMEALLRQVLESLQCP